MLPRQTIDHVTMQVKVRRAVWNVVCLLLFRPFGTKVFRLWRIALLRLFGAQVDWHVEVYASARIWAPWLLVMESGSCLGPHTIVYNQASVTLRHDVCVSQYAYICTAGHNLDQPNNAQTGLVVAPVLLGPAAWVGTRAFIGMGVEVGQEAVVGACACLFHDVAPRTVVGGNPAVVLRTI